MCEGNCPNWKMSTSAWPSRYTWKPLWKAKVIGRCCVRRCRAQMLRSVLPNRFPGENMETKCGMRVEIFLIQRFFTPCTFDLFLFGHHDIPSSLAFFFFFFFNSFYLFSEEHTPVMLRRWVMQNWGRTQEGCHLVKEADMYKNYQPRHC